MSASRIPIGVYELDTQQKLVFRDGARVSLTPKAVDLLIALASRPGEVVPKADLMAAVWPDTFVDEATLAKLVFTLRKELGETLIETIPKRGYRLTLPPPVQWGDRRPRLSSRRLFVLAALALVIAAAFLLRWENRNRPSNLAVATFTGPDPQLAHDVNEAVVSRLAILGLNVSAKQSGAELTLNGLVEHINNERIRITWRISSATDGLQIGAGAIDGNASLASDLEGRIAEQVAAVVKLRQAVRRYGDSALASPARQQTYLRAMALLVPERAQPQSDEALALLQSLGSDSQRSPFVLTALGRASLQKYGLSPKGLGLMQSYADQAARIDDAHPRVRALRGLLHRFRGEWTESEADLRASLAADPDAADVLLDLAHLLGAMSRTQDAVAAYEYLIKVHPQCAVCVNNFGVFERDTGRPEHAADLYRRAITLDPKYPGYRVNLANIDLAAGQLDDAIAQLNGAIRIGPTPDALEQLAYCQTLRGDDESAVRNLSEAVRIDPRAHTAWTALGAAQRRLHRDDDANAAFDRGIEIARSIVQLDPKEPLEHAILAECLANRGDAASAKRELAAAMTDPDPMPDALLNMAAAQTLLGDRDGAMGSLRRAGEKGMSPSLLARDPRFAPLQTMMGTRNGLPVPSLSR